MATTQTPTKPCVNGHPAKDRHRLPSGRTQCNTCKREYRQGRRMPSACRISSEARMLLRDGLTIQTDQPDVVAWQRRVFAFFGDAAQMGVA